MRRLESILAGLLIIAGVTGCKFGNNESEAKKTQVDLGLQTRAGYNNRGLAISESSVTARWGTEMTIENMKNKMASGDSKLVPKHMYGIQIELAFSPLLAKKWAKEDLEEKIEESKPLGRKKALIDLRNQISQKVYATEGITDLYNKETIEGLIDTELKSYIPAVDAGVDKAAHEAYEENADKIDKVAMRTIFQGLILTYGYKVEDGVFGDKADNSDLGDLVVYVRTGKGALEASAVGADGRNAYNNITMKNSDVKKLTGFQLTGFFTVGIVQELRRSKSSLEIAFSGVHAKGRVHFIDGTQYLLDNLNLTEDEWDASSKIYALDTFVLDVAFRQGIRKALHVTVAAGYETKFGIGASYKSEGGKLEIVIDLLYVPKTVNNLAKGFSAEALVSYRVFRYTRAWVSGGATSRVLDYRMDHSSIDDARQVESQPFIRAGITQEVFSDWYGNLSVSGSIEHRFSGKLGNDFRFGAFVSYDFGYTTARSAN